MSPPNAPLWAARPNQLPYDAICQVKIEHMQVLSPSAPEMRPVSQTIYPTKTFKWGAESELSLGHSLDLRNDTVIRELLGFRFTSSS